MYGAGPFGDVVVVDELHVLYIGKETPVERETKPIVAGELLVPIYPCSEGVVTGRDVLVVDGVPFFVFRQTLVGIGVRKFGTESVIPSCLNGGFSSVNGVARKVGVVEIELLIIVWQIVGDTCGEFVVHVVVVGGEGEIVMPFSIVGRGIEIVAELCLQIWIPSNNPDACCIEVVILLFQGRCTEAHAIAKTDVEIADGLVTHGEFRSEVRVLLV